jgi:hypothetical protein
VDEIRNLRLKLPSLGPNFAAHADRVSVYAVAVGHACGLEDEWLTHLKRFAYAHDLLRKEQLGIEPHSIGIGRMETDDLPAWLEVFDLCENFDRLAHEQGMNETDAIAELEILGYSPNVVEALKSVCPLIQPIEEIPESSVRETPS